MKSKRRVRKVLNYLSVFCFVFVFPFVSLLIFLPFARRIIFDFLFKDQSSIVVMTNIVIYQFAHLLPDSCTILYWQLKTKNKTKNCLFLPLDWHVSMFDSHLRKLLLVYLLPWMYMAE